MLAKLNSQLERKMPFITPTSVVMGVLLAGYLENLAFLIPWIFAFMTFSGSLKANFSSMKKAMTHPLPLFIVLFVLHIIMPLWAWGVGHITFSGDTYTITGLILMMAIPTGISSLIWVSIYKGSIPLTLTIILIDTLLSPIIVPLTLTLLVGAQVEMDVWSMIQGLVFMIVIPSLLAMLLNQFTKEKVSAGLSARLAPFSKIGMAIVVMINSAVVAPYLKVIDLKLIAIIVTVFFVAFTGYLFAFMIGRYLMGDDREAIIAITFNGGMRNISAGSVLAISYFPPLVALPVVIGVLFQQILAAIFGVIIERYFNKKHVVVNERAV
ncbi:bile acid:sodium symporter family protein [Cytobacillus purgationiresistens]|uniref:Na+-dependent transporter n=1 Tax=Cytobacillus purgationiresistens TaxID=863449 RepID=A0ABU0AAI9_9BACI|nr:bile acid:sodium symporter family protein [Cytobacillus purgationiresistens]MDQ0268272.1 putative Na+-dependent transporter [Cytobacillus purgationiresistens]